MRDSPGRKRQLETKLLLMPLMTCLVDCIKLVKRKSLSEKPFFFTACIHTPKHGIPQGWLRCWLKFSWYYSRLTHTCHCHGRGYRLVPHHSLFFSNLFRLVSCFPVQSVCVLFASALTPIRCFPVQRRQGQLKPFYVTYSYYRLTVSQDLYCRLNVV